MNIEAINQSVVSFITANPWIILLAVWTAVWKLFALWYAAKNNNKIMFVIIAIVNTVGILEIIYLLYLHFKHKKIQKAPEMDQMEVK